MCSLCITGGSIKDVGGSDGRKETPDMDKRWDCAKPKGESLAEISPRAGSAPKNFMSGNGVCIQLHPRCKLDMIMSPSTGKPSCKNYALCLRPAFVNLIFNKNKRTNILD